MPRNNTTSPAKIAAASRRRDAVELRMMGRTYGEIGAALGVSRPHAFRLVSAEIGRMAAEAQEATNALRALELDRLDAAQVAIYQAYLELHEHPAIFTALNADTMEIYTELVPFDAALAQRMSDRAVKVITATEAGELLPRAFNDPTHFECRMCAWQDRCWRTHA